MDMNTNRGMQNILLCVPLSCLLSWKIIGSKELLNALVAPAWIHVHHLSWKKPIRAITDTDSERHASLKKGNTEHMKKHRNVRVIVFQLNSSPFAATLTKMFVCSAAAVATSMEVVVVDVLAAANSMEIVDVFEATLLVLHQVLLRLLCLCPCPFP